MSDPKPPLPGPDDPTIEQVGAELPPSWDDRPSAIGFELTELLGTGTYGEVWKARELDTQMEVAIKFFTTHAADWDKVTQEIQNLAQTDGTPGLVQLRWAEPHARPPYLVMSFAEHGSLGRRLHRDGPMPVPQALNLFRRIVNTMAFVHAKGIRHCDLKPDNILLNQLDEPLIADFGQAKLPGDVRPSPGTYFYMAPEQAYVAADEEILRQRREEQAESGNPASSDGSHLFHGLQGRPDTRWDVYALGAIFYCMVLGKPPRAEGTLRHELEQTTELTRQLKRYRDGIRKSPPTTEHHHLPKMDRRLGRIIDRCLEVHPQRRYHDAGAIRQALEAHQEWKRRRPLVWLAGAVTALMLLTFIGLGLWLGSSAVDKAREQLVQQILRDDLATAQVMANGLTALFRERIETLERFASDDDAVQLMRHMHRRLSAYPGENPTELFNDTTHSDHQTASREREQLLRWLQEQYQQGGNRPFSTGMTVSVLVYEGEGPAAKCYHLARVEEDGAPYHWQDYPDFFQDNWAYRDWFNGEGNKADGQDRAYRPVGRTHVSEPFDSKVEGVGMCATINVPIIDEGNVIGVILTSIELEPFHEWLDEPFGEATADGDACRDCFPTIMDGRGHCFKHDAVSESRLENWRPFGEEFRQENPTLADRTILTSYHDPLDAETPYIASVAEFDPYAGADPSRRKWKVIIQHNRQAAEQPIEELRSGLLSHGWTLLGVFVAVIMLLWAGLVWMIRHLKGAARA